ncbi:MAG: SDR family NAD(P)-dependent oxidoreductase [Myxococcales bacterium]|nr:SDR family NAD(P)-dependent oxidoreductase [Myxococcales bacterium]
MSSLQKKRWTTSDVPDLEGKVVIVTGANSGIGFEATKEMARKRAKVVLACRDASKAEKALASIQKDIPDALVEFMKLDLASLASVRDFAQAFQKKYDRLDVLLNNAGIMMVPYGKTEDGFERQFGTNHLGHFALTGLLLDHIKKTPGCRVVNVSSNGHRMGKMNFQDMMYEGGKGYSSTLAYGRAKLANLLFTYELQRLFDAHNIEAIAVAAHPGGSDTNLGNHLFVVKWFAPIVRLFVQSAAMGALPSLRGCADPNVQGGQYFGPRNLFQMTGYPILVQSNKASHNQDDARRLWEMSEEWTGVRYAW